MTKGTSEATPQMRAQRFVRLLRFTRARLGRALVRRPAAQGESHFLSRRQLGKMLGVSPTMMNRYESGRIDPHEVRFGVMCQLASIMGVSVSAMALFIDAGKLSAIIETLGDSDERMAILEEPLDLDLQGTVADVETAPLAFLREQLSGFSVDLQADASLRLMQMLGGRMLELGGALEGRKEIVRQLSLGLTGRARQQAVQRYDAYLDDIAKKGRLPGDIEFWCALTRTLRVGFRGEALEGNPETLLTSLGLPVMAPEDTVEPLAAL